MDINSRPPAPENNQFTYRSTEVKVPQNPPSYYLAIPFGLGSLAFGFRTLVKFQKLGAKPPGMKREEQIKALSRLMAEFNHKEDPSIGRLKPSLTSFHFSAIGQPTQSASDLIMWLFPDDAVCFEQGLTSFFEIRKGSITASSLGERVIEMVDIAGKARLLQFSEPALNALREWRGFCIDAKTILPNTAPPLGTALPATLAVTPSSNVAQSTLSPRANQVAPELPLQRVAHKNDGVPLAKFLRALFAIILVVFLAIKIPDYRDYDRNDKQVFYILSVFLLGLTVATHLFIRTYVSRRQAKANKK
jgi:hypothetical protein